MVRPTSLQRPEQREKPRADCLGTASDIASNASSTVATATSRATKPALEAQATMFEGTPAKYRSVGLSAQASHGMWSGLLTRKG